MKVRFCIITILLLTSFPIYGQKTLSVGDNVPIFKAASDDGSTWDISKFIGKRLHCDLLFPGCNDRRMYEAGMLLTAITSTDLTSARAMVVGISGDEIENLKLFRQAENLNFPLLSDKNGTIAGSFGVPVGEGASIKRTVGGIEHELVRDHDNKKMDFYCRKGREDHLQK